MVCWPPWRSGTCRVTAGRRRRRASPCIPPTPVKLPGVILAALASLAFGTVIGPEMPLIALGGGLAVLATKGARRRPVPPQEVTVLGAAGAFAAVSTLLGSPISGAFLLMEASGLGGPTMGLVLVPGLLASGVGALIFVGLDSLPRAGYVLAGHPQLAALRPARRGGVRLGNRDRAGHRAARPGHRVAVAVRAPLRREVGQDRAPAGRSGRRGAHDHLHAGDRKAVIERAVSGQSDIGPLIQHASSCSVGTLLLVCKTLAYAVPRGSFRGGPIFPALFIGAAGGIAMSHLPGLPLVAGVAMGIGAMTAAVFKLPLTSVLLVSLLLLSDATKVMPLVIVAVVVAYVAVAHLGPRLTARARRRAGGQRRSR